MNLTKYVNDLEKLKSHFSKAPNRVYSKEKIEEKHVQLNKIINDFNTESKNTENNSEKALIVTKVDTLVKDIKNFIKQQLKLTAIIMNKAEFVKVASATLNNNFGGDPLKLNSFIDAIELLDSITENDANLKATLITFVKTRLEGKAREVIQEKPASVQDIIKTLKQKFKPENSKIVAGKIAALQIKNNNYSDFSKNVVELADALERTLISEGMTQAKAQEMAIEQTVDVCALNAKTDCARTVILSTQFSDPKDVVAKLIVVQNKEASTKQVLAYREQSNYRNNNHRGNFRGYYRGNNNNRGNNHSRNNYHQGRNYRGNNHNNYIGSNNHRGNNYNHRGNNFRGGYHNNNQRGANHGNSSNVMTLNEETPQQQQQLGEIA